MKRYQVHAEITTRHTIEIDAEDEQDANERVEGMDDCEVVNQAIYSESLGLEVQDIEEMFREDE